MYTDLHTLLAAAQERNVPLSQIVLENEIAIGDKNQQQVMEELEQYYTVMENSAHKALETPLPSTGNLITGVASVQNTYANVGNSLCGDAVNRAMALALSSSEVNASMGKICAAPTGGACGILPAVLITVRERRNLTLEQTLKGLLTASGIGVVIMKNATVSGAEGGCQAECGVAAAMAAAAAVEMSGGTPEAAIHACSIALMNIMGLVCDPVAGLVQVPCAQRNASQAVNALLSADLALAGMKSVIPADEVVAAMYQVGKKMPMELRETALGGLAVSPTAKAIAKKIMS